MNNNSVFNLYRYSSVRWWNILGHIKRIYYIAKAIYWRAKYGFTPYDTFCWYDYIGDLMHDSFMYMIENHYGHPVDMAEEEWDQYLREMAIAFKEAANEEDPKLDELGDIWCDMIDKYGRDDDRAKEAHQQYLERIKAFDKEKEEAKDKAFDMLKERFFNLWDWRG